MHSLWSWQEFIVVGHQGGAMGSWGAKTKNVASAKMLAACLTMLA